MPRLLTVGIGVVAAAMCMGGAAGFLLSRQPAATPIVLTVTDTAAPSDTPVPTDTALPTFTETASPTNTLTPSVTPTATPTLATLVVQITAVNHDVTLNPPTLTLPPTNIPSLMPTVAVPPPGDVVALVPTGNASPRVGWVRYLAEDPAVRQSGTWDVFTYTYGFSTMNYLYTNTPDASLSLHFLGAGVRVRYARLSSYGMFAVKIDDQIGATVDGYVPSTARYGDLMTTDVFGLSNGWHTLDIQRLDTRNPASTNGFVAIDSIDVYQAGLPPTALPTVTPLVPTRTATAVPVKQVQLLIAPPTVPPTATIGPPQITGVSLTVAYDLNGDKAIEPGKGVMGLPVELIAANTNQIVATGNTDAQGYIHLETTGTAPLRLVIPYFNRFWDVPLHAVGTSITLLIPPANSPALIP